MTIFQFFDILNFDLLTVGLVVAGVLVLGYVVFFDNRKSITNISFLLFAFLTALWSVSNFLVYQFSSPQIVLWILRISVFFAVWHTFTFFQFFYVFPRKEIRFHKWYIFGLVPLTIFTSILVLTPFVFERVAEFSSDGTVSKVINGPGIPIFGIVVTSLVLGGLFLLITKTSRASDIEKTQLRFILAGSAITFPLLITFNFIFPALLDNARFVPLGALFIFPFIVLTSYAVIKHQLLHIKIIATEILTFILAIAILFEVLLSQDLGILIFRISTFILVLVFGIGLIRSVQKEVEQREKLEKLTNDLESANVELKRLDKAKSEFVSIASHQLRTPLTIIKGYLSLILEGMYGKISKKMWKPIFNMQTSNDRLINLVNDLLNLSRLESGKIKLNLEDSRIEEIIQNVVDELKIVAEQKSIKLVLQKEGAPLPMFKLDQEKIRNVALNLIDNAIRYTEQGTITITISRKERALSLQVRDTGVGMQKEEIAKLFQSFSRGRAGTNLSTEGAGIGLYIAKQFVQMHEGRIWAESAGIGKGSTFYVELPLKNG